MQHYHRCLRARRWRTHVSQRCQNIPRWETGLGSANDVTHRKRMEGFGIFKKSVSWVETCIGKRRLAFPFSQRPCDACARVGGGRWKSQNRKNGNLSPYVEELLNSKVICFVPEQRRRVFNVSKFLCSLYIYIYMNIPCKFHIFMYMAMVHIYIWCQSWACRTWHCSDWVPSVSNRRSEKRLRT